MSCIKYIAVFMLACLLIGCGNTKKQAPSRKDSTPPPIVLSDEDIQNIQLIPSPYVAGNVPTPAIKEFKKVKQLMLGEQWEQAESELQLMAETFPKLSGVYVNLGIAQKRIHKFADAEKAFKFAIETNPDNFDAYAELGILYREMGRFTDSEQTYLAALKRWPHHFDSARNLGILYDLYMGRFNDALAYYRLSLAIDLASQGKQENELKGWIADLKRRMENNS